jgi:hypothetical protein
MWLLLLLRGDGGSCCRLVRLALPFGRAISATLLCICIDIQSAVGARVQDLLLLRNRVAVEHEMVIVFAQDLTIEHGTLFARHKLPVALLATETVQMVHALAYLQHLFIVQYLDAALVAIAPTMAHIAEHLDVVLFAEHDVTTSRKAPIHVGQYLLATIASQAVVVPHAVRTLQNVAVAYGRTAIGAYTMLLLLGLERRLLRLVVALVWVFDLLLCSGGVSDHLLLLVETWFG